MNWQLWIVLGSLVLAAFANFAGIDKEREPKSVDLAFAGFLYTMLIIVLFLWGMSA
jgi:hypothetical protein